MEYEINRDKNRYTVRELPETCTHSDVLRTDGIEKFGSNGNPHVSEIHEKLTTHLQSLVNLECTVDVGVVDEAFPANSRARFLSASGT